MTKIHVKPDTYNEGFPTDGPRTVIRIKALEVITLENGQYEIHIPCKPMTPEQQAILLQLFPTLSEQAYKLLDKENLLNAMV